jgi:hypothetical protein
MNQAVRKGEERTKSHKRKCQAVLGASQIQEDQQQTADSKPETTAMRLGGHLTGRALTRSKARGGDGFLSESELLAAVLQQPASDSTTACKGDLTRKLDGLPGQVSIHAAAVASTRLPLANGTTPPAAPPAPSAVSASTSKPKHQRSHSAGQAPKGGLQLQTDVANDLACIADTLVKACADQQDDSQLAAALSGSQRRSARLAGSTAAAVVSVLDSDATKHGCSSNGLIRSSAPARQHKRVPAGQLADNNGTVSKRAPTAGRADTPTPAPAALQMSESPSLLGRSSSSSGGDGSRRTESSQGRRVSFAAGPLDPEYHPNSTQDGHPASEGALAVPVRRVPVSYGMDLSRGTVLMLEQLLGTECIMSVTRLKRRVGLLPPIRPPRPYANSPGGAAAAAAAAGDRQPGKR